MSLGKPCSERNILGGSPLPRDPARDCQDLVRQDIALRRSALGARAALDEAHDCAQHRFSGGEIGLVHTKLAAAIAHHDGAIARERQGRDPAETEGTKTGEQIIRGERRDSEVERKLRRVAAGPADEAG